MTNSHNPNASSMFQQLIASRPTTEATKLERLLDLIDTMHQRCRNTVVHYPHEHYRLTSDGVDRLYCDGR
jgi:hypothetical protein